MKNWKLIRWSEVLDRRFVGSDLTFSNPVKTDGPVETVQLRTCIKWVVKIPSDRCYYIILRPKKNICVFTVFTVTRPTLIFASDPMHFYTEFG
jgi:hypothetical protein